MLQKAKSDLLLPLPFDVLSQLPRHLVIVCADRRPGSSSQMEGGTCDEEAQDAGVLVGEVEILRVASQDGTCREERDSRDDVEYLSCSH
ncbi:hypothetical protein ABZ749_23010 [Micromonospora sp. NPDC047753]|uniref:hypothetical protein n=1 Tax=Micromonospora sp. NPDC047753 TaxID=3154817 RepID=UPI003402D16D